MTATLPAIDLESVAVELATGSRLWRDIRVTTSSDDVASTPGQVVVGLQHPEPGTHQAGFSVALRRHEADVPVWITLMASTALAEAIRGDTGVAVWSVWPDSVIAPDGQAIAGAEAYEATDAMVVRFRVVFGSDGIPFGPAPAALEQYAAERPGVQSLVVEVLQAFERLYLRWSDFARDPGPSGLVADYASFCGSIKVEVEADLQNGSRLLGTAEGIDPDGRLVVRRGETITTLAPQNVSHVRPLAVLPS
ncbi:hypothetical protein [Streptomyces hirsutus]|uniref:hypothetical protein n=1 Tax=Streptomyces hirsutus TaxID=35620 RepID=UPI00331895F7